MNRFRICLSVAVYITGVVFSACSSGFALNQSAPTTAIIAALRNREYERAGKLTEEALKTDPSDPLLWSLNAMALNKTGRDKDALASYHRALALRPDYLPALEGAAEIEYKNGSDRAIPLLRRILDIRPSEQTAHAMLGVLAYKNRDCKKANENFAAGWQVIRSQEDVLKQYVACLVDVRQLDSAVTVLVALTSIHPEDPESRYELATVQMMAGHRREALNTLEPLIQQAQPTMKALRLASAAYEELGDTPRAVDLLRKGIVLYPKEPTLYLDFATMSFNHKSFQVGIDVLNTGIGHLPNSADLYLARGILYVQLADYVRGEADFEAAQQLDPETTAAQVAKGLSNMQQSNLDGAIAGLRAHLKSHPNDGYSYYLLSESLRRRGAQVGSADFEEALRTVNRALQLKPDFPLARDLLAQLYSKSGKEEQAVVEWRLALKEDPSDQTAVYSLILASKRRGNVQEMSSLVKRFADLRKEARERQVQEDRYRLVESEPGKPKQWDTSGEATKQ